jgi:hypothetical protein
MSRGHGSVQRAVLDLLAASPRAHGHAFRRDYDCPGHDSWPAYAPDAGIHRWPQWHTIVSFAGALADGVPPRALVESVRRAVRRLAAEGALEMSYTTGETFRDAWVVHATMLAVRPVLTEAECAAEAAMHEAARQRTAGYIALARAMS